MFSMAGVSLVAMPYAIARLLVSSRVVRIAAVLSLIAYASSRNYRPGEGLLSPKVSIHIVAGPGIGGILYEQAREYQELAVLQGRTFHLTESETKSLGILIEAVQASSLAVPALLDFIQHFPRSI